jgi:uncharacterized protein (DUF362 family)
MTRVAVTQNANIERAIEQALSCLDLKGLIRGRSVAVKPNETWASAEDTSGVTQGDSLRAVLQHLRRLEPREVIVTGGAGAAETEDVFRYSGMMRVIEEEGVEFFDHNRGPFTEVELPYAPERQVAGPQTTVMVNPRVLEYEVLVALNQLKMHATATVTLALKNIAMSFPAADYYGHPRHTEHHRHDFFGDLQSFIAAMAKRFPIHLAVTVGHPAMVATGPLGGYAAETGIAIASTDPLAADVVGARLLGFHLQAVQHLWEAQRLGVGNGNMEEYEFPALDMQAAIRAFTKAVYGREMTFEHA